MHAQVDGLVIMVRAARESRWGRGGLRLVPLLPLFVGGLAVTRLAYEAFFPRWTWLAQPLPAISLALLLTLLAGGVWYAFSLEQKHNFSAWAFFPLLLNLLYLFRPEVDLVYSRLIAGASVWLTIVFALHSRRSGKDTGPVPIQVSRRTALALLWLALLPVYLLTMSRTVGQADTFEFQVVAPQLGVAHPTGYPLYLLLGKLWTMLVPIGSVAWRLNLGTAIYGLLAASCLYLFALRLLRQSLYPLLGAVALGLTHTYWSQAIEAEVYTLHALFICAALWLFYEIVIEKPTPAAARPVVRNWKLPLLAFVIGLGMTNHLTTVLLLLPFLFLLPLTYLRNQSTPATILRSLSIAAVALLLPLALYAYLPIRWAAVNGEAMGLDRFVDWVVAGRFHGAWQWRAWLDDPTRTSIVARLFVQDWGLINLALAGIGLVYLGLRQWRVALLLGVTWLGFVFYALNYYVPDLAVFLLGAQIVVAVWWMAGVAAVARLVWRLTGWPDLRLAVCGLLFMPVLLLAVQTWPQVDQAQDDGLIQWGQAVLRQPLEANAAVMVDSEKIAPLYYLQQIEGMRPDLEIIVLPDEATYRAELHTRLAAGQPVYLARFVPGLEAAFHLRSAGPLTEVSLVPLSHLPVTATPTQLDFGDMRLVGYEVAAESPYASQETAVTLYWQALNPMSQPFHVYVRWAGQEPLVAAGQHPAGNYYPTYAWQVGELVSDFYQLPHPVSPRAEDRQLQVATALPFTRATDLAWQTVAHVLLPATGRLELGQPMRARLGSTYLTSAQLAAQARPAATLPVIVSGYGEPPGSSDFRIGAAPQRDQAVQPAVTAGTPRQEFSYATELDTGTANGRVPVWIQHPSAVCGWLQRSTDGCVLGMVDVSEGLLPQGAINFEDKVALLDVDIPDKQLAPGDRLLVTLTWQGLAPMGVDYTVFVQVLDDRDHIAGQVDAWPVQGTRPTSQWEPGEIIVDPYVLQLDDNLPAGPYRVIVGLYQLSDLRRLMVLNQDGVPIDDKYLVPGLQVP